MGGSAVHPRAVRAPSRTGRRGPSCGSAPTRRGCRGSPTGATSPPPPARCPTCSRCWRRRSHCRCRPIPSAEQAQAGYHAGKFPDPYAKPELLCALTEFEAFCGVRPVDETVALLEELGLRRFAAAFESSGVEGTIDALLRRKVDIGPIVEACAASNRPESRWAVRLADRYPGDPSVAVTLLLNYIQLEPGEAIQLAPGNLHCYLGGAGVELMGASDNVVRAGLTTKPIDVDTVLEVMDPTPLLDPVMSAARVYPLAGTSIRLLRLTGPSERRAKTHELVIVVPGRVGYLAPGDRLDIQSGETAYVATA